MERDESSMWKNSYVPPLQQMEFDLDLIYRYRQNVTKKLIYYHGEELKTETITRRKKKQQNARFSGHKAFKVTDNKCSDSPLKSASLQSPKV